MVALAEEIVPYRGVYISHERSEGTDPMWFWPSVDGNGAPTLLDAVTETIEIGERSGAIVVASHLKAKGAHFWGASRAAIQLIDSARARGVQVYADHYPYETTGTDGTAVLLPPWALLEGGEGIVAEGIDPTETSNTDYAARLRPVLADPARAAALRTDIAHEIRRRGGADRLLILDHPDQRFVGKSLADAARIRRVEPLEMAILLQTEGYRNRVGGALVRGFSLSEIDIDLIAAKNWAAAASDAGIALPNDRFAHPRFYGTFPRKIRRYALERGVLSLEDAVRSATSLPAQILGLTNRGAIREGMIADITIFDPRRPRQIRSPERASIFGGGRVGAGQRNGGGRGWQVYRRPPGPRGAQPEGWALVVFRSLTVPAVSGTGFLLGVSADWRGRDPDCRRIRGPDSIRFCRRTTVLRSQLASLRDLFRSKAGNHPKVRGESRKIRQGCALCTQHARHAAEQGEPADDLRTSKRERGAPSRP